MQCFSIPIKDERVNFILIHHEGDAANSGKKGALTIDFKSNDDCGSHERVFAVQGKPWRLFDGHGDDEFHNELHRNIASFHGVQPNATFTDHHQHWVRLSAGNWSLGELRFILSGLKELNIIDQKAVLNSLEEAADFDN
jgi:hypothetical protein